MTFIVLNWKIIDMLVQMHVGGIFNIVVPWITLISQELGFSIRGWEHVRFHLFNVYIIPKLCAV